MKTYLEQEEIQEMINSCPKDRDKLILRLLWRLGCRVSELVGINQDQVDFKNKTITIQHLKSGIYRNCPKCNKRVGRKHPFCPYCGQDVSKVKLLGQEAKVRTIPVDEETLELIKKIPRNSLRENRGRTKGDRSKLIPLDTCTIYNIVREAGERIGLKGRILFYSETGKGHFVSPHRFRDALAVRWLERRSDLEGRKALQEHFGHSRFETSARYFRLKPEIGRKIYDKIWEEENGKEKKGESSSKKGVEN